MGQAAEKLDNAGAPSGDVRRALLDQLALQPGQAVVMRRRAESGEDMLVVRLAPGVRLQARPSRFGDFEVAYETARPPRAGRW
jgi:hypothetical protein